MHTAFVKIWGKLAGAVAWDESKGLASFEYDAQFKKLNWDLSPLKMPLNAAKSIFNFPELKAANNELDTFKALPGLLADVLPDKYGNQLMNVWLTQQGRAPNSMNPVEMLCFIGSRGMGALEFEPVMLQEQPRAFNIELDHLVEMAQFVLAQKAAFRTNVLKQKSSAFGDILKIGTSAGGARPKAVIAYNPKTGEVRSGQTKAPQGFEHWLIKLDGVSDVQMGATKGYGRVEMAYYHMALACGIHMMPSVLMEENGRAHFMTKRFDRDDNNTKHHIQTFCAIKHLDFNAVTSFSYEQLFQTMRELKLSYAEAEQMFKRMVFNVMARNCDDHTKNFAFRLKMNGHWELAPAYDICHAYQPKHQWVSQHALSVNGKRRQINKKDFLRIGESIGCKQAASIIEEIEHHVMRWKFFAKDCDVAPKLNAAIDKTIKDRTI